jgi:gluconolactonase
MNLMKKLILFLITVGCTGVLSLSAQQKKKKLVHNNAQIEKVGTDFIFTEGPAVASDGRVYFTDQPNNKIHIWDENEGISLYLEGSGRSNGMYFNADGHLVSCADEKNQLIYFDADKKQHVIHEGFEGKHLNAPNDLWIAPNGGIYFSDPYYHRKWWKDGHKEIQETRGVYYLSLKGKISRVIDDFKTPNGLIGTPDGKTLYVADIEAKKIWKYSIQPNGSLSNKTFFAPHGSDGMTIDNRGNIYLTSGKVWVYTPNGELIYEIVPPEAPSNVCFGGKKRNTLFITARTSVYTLKMRVKGVDYKFR